LRGKGHEVRRLPEASEAAEASEKKHRTRGNGSPGEGVKMEYKPNILAFCCNW
jgi:hypothetical protein